MNKISRLTFCSVCTAFCAVLSLLTERIPWLARGLSPFHIPIFICGIMCGSVSGLLVGFFVPFFCFALQGLPPIFPNGIAMSFELATYGLVSGWLRQKSGKKENKTLIVELLASMALGRVTWAIFMFFALGLRDIRFLVSLYVSNIVATFPGILLQLVLVPLIVKVLENEVFMGSV